MDVNTDYNLIPMHNSISSNPNTRHFTIKRLMLVQSREGYKDVPHRSYKTNVTAQTLDKLNEMLHPNNSPYLSTVNPNEIAYNTPNVVTLNSTPYAQANIVNGWGIERIRFLLEVESYLGELAIISYVQGYSDYNDVSYAGHIDPNITYYINSIITVNRQCDPVTGAIIVRPVSSFNVLSNNNPISDIDILYSDNQDVLVRPYDIYTSLFTQSQYANNSTTVRNISQQHNPGSAAKLSKRDNANPVKYFSNIVNAYASAQLAADMSYDMTDILKGARTNVNDGDYYSLPLIQALFNLTGDLTPTRFRLSDLEQLDPSLQHKTIYIKRDNLSVISNIASNNILETNDTMDAYQPTIINTKACYLNSVIPSIMIESFITDMTISISNNNIDGKVIITPWNFNSFINDIDITHYMDRVIAKIEQLVIPYITDNNLSIVEILLTSNVFGDTTISININNSGPVVYRFPTFCDSLFAPVISSFSNSELIKEDVNNIIDSNFNNVFNSIQI